MRCTGKGGGNGRHAHHRTPKVRCAKHGINPLSSGRRAPSRCAIRLDPPLPSRYTRLFLCPLVHLATALTTDAAPSYGGGIAPRTPARDSRASYGGRPQNGDTGMRGARPASNTWPRIRCAWNARGAAGSRQQPLSTTGYPTGAIAPCSGIGTIGNRCAPDATTARLHAANDPMRQPSQRTNTRERNRGISKSLGPFALDRLPYPFFRMLAS